VLLKSTEDAALDPVLTPLDSWLVRFSHLHRQSFLAPPFSTSGLILMKDSVIADVEKPCFHALLIQYHRYKLLLLEYAVLQIFISPELDLVARLRRLQETTWGRHFVLSAKTVLTEFVRFGEQPYASSLSQAPNHLFNLVCIVTLLLIKTKHLHGASHCICPPSRRWLRG
jgi:hypothetical protein